MVGAIVLILIAIVAGGLSLLGVVNWFISGEISQSTLMLGIIATVALSGALIIDGIRFYADKLATQMNYLLMPNRNAAANASTMASPTTPAAPSASPTTNLRPPSQLSSSGANLAARPGQRFRIIGKDRGNGMDTELVVQAADQTAALRLGEQKGIEVRRVEIVA
jgi:hypothetical protein